MIAYRRDIDGLRALAVLAVIIFHTRPDSLRGGYAGVDIFFVISGFLIAAILKRDLYNNEFSLAGFYERRCRRILPALFTVILASLGAFWFALFPADYIELAKSAIAAALSVSNIFFWSVIDYFSSAADEKPLLHSWSLGVEEQFYLFFPLILYGLDKYFPEKRVALIIAGLGLVSLAFAGYASRHYASFAFYQLPARFWELALGAFLAYLPRYEAPQRLKDAASWLGLVMIVSAFIFYTDKTPFPGLPALLPCMGAGLLLLNENTVAARKILSRSAVVLIGKMSYSLYLWHWVVLAFWRTRFEENGILGAFFTLAIVFALSYLSWRFIETPFRNRAFLTRKQVFGFSLFGVFAIIALSGAIILKDGLPTRFSPRAFAIAEAAQDYQGTVFEKCVEPTHGNDPDCQFGDLSKPAPTALLWGDSHAGANAVLLDAFGKKHRFRGLKMTKSSCPGLTGDYDFNHGGQEVADCRAFNQKVLAYILAHKNIKYIFLSARWAPIAKTIRFDGSKEGAFLRALQNTTRILQKENRKIFIIAAEPETPFDVPRCLSRKESFGSAFFKCRPLDLKAYMKQQENTLPVFSELSEDVPVFYPHQALCASGICHVTSGDDILYFDDDHLSRKGALYLLPGLEQAFAPYFPAGH